MYCNVTSAFQFHLSLAVKIILYSRRYGTLAIQLETVHNKVSIMSLTDSKQFSCRPLLFRGRQLAAVADQ